MPAKIEYVYLKDTKNKLVFTPLRGEDEPAGLATLYLEKGFCQSNGITPLKGLTVTIEVNK